MRVRHATRDELERETRSAGGGWSTAVCRRLLRLVGEESSRVLVAEENGHLRAVLGLRMDRAGGAGPRTARIVELALDPRQSQRGIGSLLVRFAEDIAFIEGCSRVDVDSSIEGWGDGECWPSLGYSGPAECGMFKSLRRLHAGCRC